MSECEMCWRGVLGRQAYSGEAVAEFCAAEGVSTAAFYSWRKRLLERQDRQSRAIEDHLPQLRPQSGQSFLCLQPTDHRTARRANRESPSRPG